jgi:rSAM/selenodomain-associated transferase 2
MRFSIILPVLNEEATIESQLLHLNTLCAQHDCEILVVDGGSSDATITIAQRHAQVIAAKRGRATQMNAGAQVASGEMLLFLHADTILPQDALFRIEEALKQPGVVGGAFRMCFNCHQWPYRLVAFFTNIRSRMLNVYTGDQAYFMWARSFQEIGGYPEQELMEDLEIITRLRKHGRLVLLPQYVVTSARRHEQIGLVRSVFFMWYLRTLYRFGVSPAQLRVMYMDVR